MIVIKKTKEKVAVVFEDRCNDFHQWAQHAFDVAYTANEALILNTDTANLKKLPINEVQFLNDQRNKLDSVSKQSRRRLEIRNIRKSSIIA